MVQAQGVYASAGASAQVSVDGDPPYINYPLIIGGLAIVGIIVAAVVLRK